METQLTAQEIKARQQLLEAYKPAQKAFAALENNNGQLEASFDELWAEQTKQMSGGKSLWQSTLKVLREEICGDEGFQATSDF
jgi:hypothetical protein